MNEIENFLSSHISQWFSGEGQKDLPIETIVAGYPEDSEAARGALLFCARAALGRLTPDDLESIGSDADLSPLVALARVMDVDDRAAEKVRPMLDCLAARPWLLDEGAKIEWAEMKTVLGGYDENFSAAWSGDLVIVTNVDATGMFLWAAGAPVVLP